MVLQLCQLSSSASSPIIRPAADCPLDSLLQPGESATAGLQQELSAGQPSPATDLEEPREPVSAPAAGIRPSNSQSNPSQHGSSEEDDSDDSDAESPARPQQPSQTTAAATTSQPDSSLLTADEFIIVLVGNPDTLKQVQGTAQLHTAIQKLVEGCRTLYTQKQAAEQDRHRLTEAMQVLVTCVHGNMQNVQAGIAAAQSALSSGVITPVQPPAGSFPGWTMTAHRVEGPHLGLIDDPAADLTQIWLFILQPPVAGEDDGASTDHAVHLFLPDDALNLIGL